MKIFPILNYAAPADNPGGDAPVMPPVEPPPAQPPTAGTKAGTDAPEAKFTQADLDRAASERAKHAKSAERAALLKELGVEDLDAVKAAMQAATEAAKAKMTEAERAQAERAELEKRLQLAEAGKTEAELARKAALLEAEIVSKASGRFANPRAVAKLADLSKVEFKDGKFAGVDEALTALAEAEPWTLAPVSSGTVKPPAIGTTNGGQGKRGESDADLKARFFGGGGARIFDKKAGGVVVNHK